ncbi:MAG: hypothetical protein QOG90_2289, partial [Actinomycetota bacterium]
MAQEKTQPDADTPERVLTYIANALVDDAEAVEIDADHG